MHAMPRRLRPAVGLAVGLAVLMLSGCGSSGTSTATGHTSSAAFSAKAAISKTQFVARAEAICRTLNAQEKPLRERQESLKGLPADTTAAKFVSLVNQVVVLSRAAEAKLQALPRPAGDAQAIETLLTGFSDETTDATAIAKAASNQESTPGEDAEDALKRAVEGISTLANTYGMKNCVGSD